MTVAAQFRVANRPVASAERSAGKRPQAIEAAAKAAAHPLAASQAHKTLARTALRGLRVSPAAKGW